LRNAVVSGCGARALAAEPRTSLLAAATRVAGARGAKLIVADLRRIGFVVKADCWLPVRPGADAALAMALTGIMIAEGWFDAEFVRDWTNGPLLVREDSGALLRAEGWRAAA
jgi:anaerobic selenocysteine-containing dehydrogenase